MLVEFFISKDRRQMLERTKYMLPSRQNVTHFKEDFLCKSYRSQPSSQQQEVEA
jgi:ABC-type thiamine transport system substrate-binding protein